VQPDYPGRGGIPDIRQRLWDVEQSAIDETEARAIAVEEVERPIFNPLPAINAGLNPGL
jgi:hypothetical protein